MFEDLVTEDGRDLRLEIKELLEKQSKTALEMVEVDKETMSGVNRMWKAAGNEILDVYMRILSRDEIISYLDWTKTYLYEKGIELQLEIHRIMTSAFEKRIEEDDEKERKANKMFFDALNNISKIEEAQDLKAIHGVDAEMDSFLWDSKEEGDKGGV